MTDFKTITSRENSLIKLAFSLQNSSKARRDNGLFLIEGLRICKDAIDNGIKFEKLIVSETAIKKYEDDVSLFSKNAVESFVITDSLFKKISDTTSPQGIIAICKIKTENKNKIDKKGRYIALENIADPSNLGAVSRTAEALGVTGIIVSSISCDPFSPKALRSSMGTLLRMPVIVLDDFSNEIGKLGLKTYSCVVDKDATSINEIIFSDSSVIIIGNEANGITKETKENSDYLITIPMSGNAESLNAAVAASIVMWEMMK